MICNNCGSEIQEGQVFCPNCGAQAGAAPAAPAAPVYQAQPVAKTVSGGNVLTFGILGLALSEAGILGIIFSAIGKKKAKQYEAENGSLTGPAKVGGILAKIGLIISIVMTAFWPIYIIYIAAMTAAIGSYY